MRIAFINHHTSFVSENETLTQCVQKARRDFKHISPNLTLITMAAMTPERDEVKCIDETYQPIDFNEEYDIVALTAMTFQAKRAYEIAYEFKQRGAYIVIGGIHATLVPDDVLKYADTVISSEAEGAWEEFLEDFSNKKPKPVYYGKNRPLELSPPPRFDLYSELIPPGSEDELCFLSVNFTRGCPLDCEFCASTKSYGRKFRKKSLDQVRSEIRACKVVAEKNKLNRWALYIRDDNPFIDRKYAIEVLETLNEEGVAWVSLSDIRIAQDEELIRLVGAGKCLSLSFGLESLSFETLQQVEPWKARKLKDYLECYETMTNLGVLPGATFVLGLDHETPDCFDHVAEFLDRTGAIGTFFIATPFPNTRYALRLQSEGRLSQEPYWERCNLYNVCHELKGMTKEALYQGVVNLYKTYHNLEYAKANAARMGAMRFRLNQHTVPTFPSQVVR